MVKTAIPPKRIIFIILLIAACGAWFTVAFQIGRALLPARNAEARMVNDPAAMPEVFVYRSDFPDPFNSRLLVRPRVVARSSAPAVVKLPECRIGGIVYNPANPMFLMLHGGKSDMVKKGDVIDSMLVKEIWKDSVRIVYRGKPFTLVK